jgi:hypothetical protein
MHFKEANKEYAAAVVEELNDIEHFMYQVDFLLSKVTKPIKELGEIPYVFDIKFSNEVGDNCK